MTESLPVFKVGTRASKLALAQTKFACERLAASLPGTHFEEAVFSSPGDRDQSADLRTAPQDFFTRDLDDALLNGRIDAAIHSAKDMPERDVEGLDWFWLPWREDARDALVLAPGRAISDLPAEPVAGVSSARREAWCLRRFPNAEPRQIRGTIEQRLALLDAGRYDLIVMAGAALLRLGMAGRITEWIEPGELPPPDGQGVLCLSFRAEDERFRLLRGLFVKTAVFAGAGAGNAEQATLACAAALGRAEVCLHDALIDAALLELLPQSAQRLDVGKRCGNHGSGQQAVTDEILRHVRRGKRVVRLKGGDPGMFGRLAEETEALEAHGLPFRALPGISSLQAATTATGFLLTRRGASRGFCAMTPREQNAGIAAINAKARERLPLVLFMAIKAADQVAAQLSADAWPPETPAAIVINAGFDDETIMQSTLAGLPELAAAEASGRPGLIIIGEAARRRFRFSGGALFGRRILLTCSSAIIDKAVCAVRDLGGAPVPRPLFRAAPCADADAKFADLGRYDSVIITSPSAAQALFETMDRLRIDLRRLPVLLVCGPGTAEAAAKRGLRPAAMPESDFGAAGLMGILPQHIKPGRRILRLRSDLAGPGLANELKKIGAEVDDVVLYRNEAIVTQHPPDFDAAILASASAAERLVEIVGAQRLATKDMAVIGRPTAAALERHGLKYAALAEQPTVEATVFALAQEWVGRALRKLLRIAPA